MSLHNEVFGHLQNGQCGQTQEVELDQANRFHIVFVKLTDRRRAAGLLVQRAKIRQFARRDQDTTCMHTNVACQAFEFLRQVQQDFDFVFLRQALRQHRLLFKRNRNRHVLTGFVGNQLGQTFAKGVAHVQGATDISNGGTCRHGAERDNLTDGFASVLVLHVINHTITIGLTKVNIEIGHGNPLRVEKPLKQQVVAQRVQVGNVQGVGHQRTGPRASAWPHRTAIVFGPIDEVADDQKVAGKAHFQNRFDFEIQPVFINSAIFLSNDIVRKEMPKSIFQALK